MIILLIIIALIVIYFVHKKKVENDEIMRRKTIISSKEQAIHSQEVYLPKKAEYIAAEKSVCERFESCLKNDIEGNRDLDITFKFHTDSIWTSDGEDGYCWYSWKDQGIELTVDQVFAVRNLCQSKMIAICRKCGISEGNVSFKANDALTRNYEIVDDARLDVLIKIHKKAELRHL